MTSDATDVTAGGSEARGGLVPRLRFPEFRDAGAWEATALGRLSDVVRGGSPRPIDGYLTTAKSGLNWLKIGDVDKEAKFVTGTAEKVRTEALNMTRVVQPGELILSNSMSFGRPYILEIETCIHDGWIAITKLSRQIERDYLYYQVSAPSSQSYFNANAAGSGVKNLNADIIKVLPIGLPKIAEQKKIADCLSSLDALIAAEGERLAALKEYKKGLLQALFPTEGQSTPRLRFPEFRDTGEWGERTLAGLTDMKAGKFIRAADISGVRKEGLFPCFGGNGLRGYTSNYTHSGKYPLIGRQGALCGNVNLASGSFYATEHAVVAKARSGVSVDWLYHLLVRFDLNRFKTGQAQPGLSVEVIDRLPCLVPKEMEEQQRIADCLSWLDKLIAIEMQRLAALKVHKAALMQQLFPSSAEATE